MATEVMMPRLGWTMEEGTLVQWLKQDGDSVQVGDLLCVVEGDKASSEVESFDAGTLRIPATSPLLGAVVPVGTVLAYILEPGEALPASTQAPAGGAQESGVRSQESSNGHAPTASEELISDIQPLVSEARSLAISPRAKRVAKELGVDWSALTGSGRTGRIVERDVRAAARTQATPVRVSPLARRVAEDLGVDVGQLATDAPGRRIGRAEVEQAARVAKPAPVAGTATPLSGIRKISAARLTESARTVVPVTLTTDADATELARLRKQIAADLKPSGLPVPSYNDMLVKIVAVALSEHPALNASLVDEGILQHAAANIGVAVDTDRGLLVPVVRDAGQRSLQQIAADSAGLIERARMGKSKGDELGGGTFTISNLGMFQIDAFTPIINLPECAILGVGRIQARPVVVDEENDTVEVRRMMALSLTFDHRVVDGAPAARFLNRVRQFIERPYLWLTR